MFCPFFTEAFTQLFANLDNFSFVFAFDCFTVQFTHLYSFERLVEIFKLQIVEIRGTFARFFQKTLYGAGIDLTDVCCCLNRAAMAETFDNAYNIGNFLRRLALPKSINDWSLRTMREKLVKIGAKVVNHSRYVTFQMAEVLVSKAVFNEILERIHRLKPVPLGYD